MTRRAHPAVAVRSAHSGHLDGPPRGTRPLRIPSFILVLMAGAIAVLPTHLPAQEAGGLAPFAWMAGCWEGTLSSGAVYEEWWMPDRGGLMVGIARMTREGRPVSFEHMYLILDGETPVFVAQPSQSPTKTTFRLSEQAEGTFLFENPEHDFPQRIRYSSPVSGRPFARIEGGEGAEARGLDFPLVRGSCPEGG